MYVSQDKAQKAESVFREHGGLLRTTQAMDLGIHPRTLYYLRDEGRLEQLSRGVYRLADLPPLDAPDLVTVATRIPDATLCLISAMAFHEITTEIPHAVHIALARSKGQPALDYPPLQVYRFSGEALTAGVETHELGGVDVRIYNPAKTVADGLKFRGQIGQDTAAQALRRVLDERKAQPAELMEYARICRVETLMQTYLEALV